MALWGFHDYLGDVYYDFYADYSDDTHEPTEHQEKGKIIKLGGQLRREPLAITAPTKNWRFSG